MNTVRSPRPDSEPTQSPHSLGELYLTFTLLALQGFGGVLAVAHRSLVERKRWLDRQEFMELLSVSQLLPGANIVNLALILGDRHFGWRGALMALAGMLSVPLCLVMMLAAIYNQFADHAMMAGAMRGMGAVAAGLTSSLALKLMRSLRGNPLGTPWCAALGTATVIAVAVLRLPLVWVVPLLGALGWSIAFWRLRSREGVQ